MEGVPTVLYLSLAITTAPLADQNLTISARFPRTYFLRTPLNGVFFLSI